MKRWLWWFLLAPQSFLFAGLWRDCGLPPLDASGLLCLFFVVAADRRALPGLLLGAAAGRAIVDEAGLAVQILVLGIPVAVLLPLRSLFFGQRWVWQATAAALCAVAIPKLAGLLGRWFDQPSQSASFDLVGIVWAALLLPPLLSLVRLLPPFAAFVEEDLA